MGEIAAQALAGLRGKQRAKGVEGADDALKRAPGILAGLKEGEIAGHLVLIGGTQERQSASVWQMMQIGVAPL